MRRHGTDMRRYRATASAFALVCAAIASASAQVKTTVPDVVPDARPATIERITIHGKALEGNLEGDAVDRPVIVFLPPGYASERNRRYPVVYALHGYSIGAEQWTQEIHVADAKRRAATPTVEWGRRMDAATGDRRS